MCLPWACKVLWETITQPPRRSHAYALIHDFADYYYFAVIGGESSCYFLPLTFKFCKQLLSQKNAVFPASLDQTLSHRAPNVNPPPAIINFSLVHSRTEPVSFQKSSEAVDYFGTEGAFHLSEMAGWTSQLANEIGFFQRVFAEKPQLIPSSSCILS